MRITNDWFSHNIPNWTPLFKPFYGLDNLEFLEIGCYEGMATYWLCNNVLTGANCRMTVVDTFEGSIEHNSDVARTDFSEVESRFRENLARFIEAGLVDVFRNKSQNYLRELDAPRFDFIYIDGSHTSPDVLADAVLSWPLLKSGGMMIFDDYEWVGYPNQPELNPKLAIDSFLAVMAGQYEILTKGYQVAIKKL